MLVMGPWLHGGWSRGDGESLGDVHFNAKTAEFYREQIELPFFEFHLKGNGEFKHPEAWVFETGTNLWRKHDAWPPKTAKRQVALFSRRRPAVVERRRPSDGARASTNTSAIRPSRCRTSTRSPSA